MEVCTYQSLFKPAYIVADETHLGNQTASPIPLEVYLSETPAATAVISTTGPGPRQFKGAPTIREKSKICRKYQAEFI